METPNVKSSLTGGGTRSPLPLPLLGPLTTLSFLKVIKETHGYVYYISGLPGLPGLL
jgi:hypothetical protein